jgi:integrase
METKDRLLEERASRNASGAGSRPRLRKDGLWCVHLSCGSAVNDSGEVVRVRRSVYGRTAEEAERKAATLRAGLATECVSSRRELTVAELLDRWLARKRSCAPGTYASYEQQVRLYLTPYLGQRPLAALTVDDVQDFVDWLASCATARGGPFAAGSVRLALGALRQALKYALVRGLIECNIAADVRVWGVRSRRPRFLTTAEAARLLIAARGNRHEVLYRVALILGLRQGELLGLRWASVDLDGGHIAVREQLQRRMPGEGTGARLVLRGLKSDAAHRTIPLPSAQDSLRQRHGPTWNAEGFVFVSRKGTPLDGAHLTVAFKKIVVRAGLPPMRFHDLRHSAASFLGADGVPVEVAKAILGHTDVRLTLNLYRHVQPEEFDRAAAAMERRLGKLS